MYTKYLYFYYRSTNKNAYNSVIFHFSAWHLRLFKAETCLKHKTTRCQQLSQKANRIINQYILYCTIDNVTALKTMQLKYTQNCGHDQGQFIYISHGQDSKAKSTQQLSLKNY